MVIDPKLKNTFDQAVINGDAITVENLIKNLNIIEYLASQNVPGEPDSLSRAVFYKHTEIVRLLLSVDVVKQNLINIHQFSVVYDAAVRNRTDILKLLFEIKEVKDNAAAKDNDALHWAVAMSHKETVEFLLGIPSVVHAISAKDHRALIDATNKKDWNIVLKLLEHYGTNHIPLALAKQVLAAPKDHPASERIKAHIKNLLEPKDAFDQAVINGDAVTVKNLIKNSNIIEYLASQNVRDKPDSLSRAVFYKHTEIVRLLLSVDVVKQNLINIHQFSVVHHAAVRNRTDILKLLFEIKEVKDNAAANDNDALHWAVAMRHKETVEFLLGIPSVVHAISAKDHQALIDATNKKDWNIVLKLLEHYGTNHIPLALAKQVLAAPKDHPASERIMALVLDRVIIANGDTQTSPDEAIIIASWIKHWNFSPWPEYKPIVRSSWRDYLFEQSALCNDPKQAAILLLCLNSMASNHIRLLANDNMPGGNESSMEKSLVKKVAEHYAKHIEPEFSNKFTLAGGVEGIEQTIKWVILNKIIKSTSEPTLQSDIILRKENILEGIEKDILWARSIFTSKNDIYHIAWRAYDRGAKTVLWENLLTAPTKADENTIIYSTVETGSGEKNLLSASNTIRKMAAHYFLVAIDERLTQEEHEDALESFIASIAEIRRAHNNDEIGEDSPSCFPGCFSRLHEVTKRNRYIENNEVDLASTIKEIFIQGLERVLSRAFTPCDKFKAHQLYDALVMLSKDNAWDVILNPDSVWCPSLIEKDDCCYNTELLKTRKAFLDKYLPAIKVFEDFDKVLKEKYKIVMNKDDRVLVQALLTDIGGGDATMYITSAYKKRIKILDANIGATSSVLQLSHAPEKPSDTPTTSNIPKPE